MAANDLTALLTDIDSVINTALGIEANTSHAQTVATILPIAKRMAKMEITIRMAEKAQDKSIVMDMMSQLASLGLTDPIQLTARERAMLIDAWSTNETGTTGKKRICGVYSTRTGLPIYQP